MVSSHHCNVKADLFQTLNGYASLNCINSIMMQRQRPGFQMDMITIPRLLSLASSKTIFKDKALMNTSLFITIALIEQFAALNC